jgi:outer membrane protein assembly factor BamB
MRKALLILATLAVMSPSWTADWPNWRGPDYNGSADETNLPSSWSETENLAWATELPGPGEATPIVWGDRVFVSSADKGGNDLHALCLSVRDGKVLWRKKVAEVVRRAPNNSMACPSPVTDGKRVYFLFGTGNLAAFDVDGSEVWARDLEADFGRFSVKWGYGSSPLLYDGKLYVQVVRREQPYEWSGEGEWPTDSFLLALDADTGKDVWKQPREPDGVDENQDAYSTPVLYAHAGRTEIVLAGGDCVTGHDPATGQELWRLGYNLNGAGMWRLVTSPVPGDGLVYGVMPRGGNSLFAIPAGRSGTIAWEDLAWTYDTFTPDVCVPLVYQGRLYVLADGKRVLSCLDPKTGKQLWQGELAQEGQRGGGRGVFRASPLGADGKVYLMDEAGEAIVLAAGDEFKVLSRIPMGGGKNRSSLVAAQGRLFIRTSEKLYCVAKQ